MENGKIKSKKRLKLFHGTVLTAFLIGIAIAVMFMPSLLGPFGIHSRDWRVLATDASPGSGNCGIINVYVYPHQSDTSTYNSALSESTAYAHFDSTPSLNESLEGNVPYNTAFDIAVTYQFNYTVAYNTSSSSWDKDYVKALITSSDLGIASDTEMSEGDFYAITGNSPGDTAKINFYINNAGSGYQIAHGETVNVTSLVIQGYY